MAMQKAIVIQSAGNAQVVRVPVTSAKANHVVVQTAAVALNPIDVVYIDSMPAPGCIVGCDFAGVIESVGDGVNRDLEVGDRVGGWIMGSNALQPEAGAFAEHALGHADILFKIPSSMTDPEAATFPLAVTTAGIGLYKTLGLPRPSTPSGEATPVLIYGGNTAVGAASIQLAKLSGLNVITTCSPSGNAYVTSLGVSHVFSYKSPNCGAEIATAFPNLSLVLDCISNASSTTICTAALGPKGGHHAIVLPPSIPARENVKTTAVRSFAVFGIAYKMGIELSADKAVADWAKDWWAEAGELLATGKIKAHNPDVREGGLEGVLVGLDDYRNKRVSGQKLVYKM